MGQTVRKKKVRPPKAYSAAREAPATECGLRRSLRRRNVKYFFDLDDYLDDDEFFENDEDHRRREKKLKLLLELQSGGGEPKPTAPQRIRTRRLGQAPASSSGLGGKPSKKRKIINEEICENTDDETDGANDENDDEVREQKPRPMAEESPSKVPSGLPLPDKKALELILDKLQKKDTYGVYAEPVDSEELPDYHDVIKHPMDFATVRSTLRNRLYATLEQFESDVFLICSNAMQYNSPDTIYHKQACSIKELAMKKFHKIRLNDECSEKDVKRTQKMRSSSTSKKQIKRSVSQIMREPPTSDFTCRDLLATAVDVHSASNVVQAVGCEKPDNSDLLVEENSFFSDNNLDKAEETLPGKGRVSRFGRESFVHSENRCATYSTSLAHVVGGPESIFSTFEGETKQLVPVGLYSENSYARSLARFAATLGSVAWKFTSERIERVVPQGFKFGRGWVGECEPLPSPVLILENCTVREPPSLAKVQPTADPKKIANIRMVSVPSKENPGSVPLLVEDRFPFLDSAGKTSSLPVKKHAVRASVSEMKPSFFLSPGISRTGGSANLGKLHQNSQSRSSVESDERVLKQLQLKGTPSVNKDAAEPNGHREISRSSEMEATILTELNTRNIDFSLLKAFKQADNKGVVVEVFPNGKVVGNTLENNAIASSSSDLGKATRFYPHELAQGLSDPVQLMRLPATKAQNQQISLNKSSDDAPQVLTSAPSSNINYPSIGAVAAAHACISVGAVAFRTERNSNPCKNQITADSQYNLTDEIQQQLALFRGESPAPGGVHFQPEKNGSLFRALAPQGPIPNRVDNEMQFHNQLMAYPQLVTADLSRFQLQSTWRNLNPRMHSGHEQESFRPDSSIGVQSWGSPGRASSGIMVNSQQLDSALQLRQFM